MKNKKILPNTLVPKALRFKLYQQTYDDIINQKPIARGLCISLPMYLWGLDYLFDNAPNGEEWYGEDTPNMFPEIGDEIKRLTKLKLMKKGGFMNPNDRIAFLEKILNITKDNEQI